MADVVFDPPRVVEIPAAGAGARGSVRLAYREWGAAGAPPLLLLHGITSSSLSWARVGPVLGARYRVVAPDLKGHGDSGRPPAGYLLENQAAEVAALARALGIARAGVVGHSWGGAIALHLATSTDLAGRLVLEDPSIVLTRERAVEVAPSYGAQVGLTRAAGEAAFATERPRGWTDVDVAGKVDAMVKGSPDAVRAVFAESGGWDLRPLFGRLRCPTLLVLAEPALGGIVGAEVVEAVRAGAPDMRIVTVPGADHNVHRTELAAFLAAVEPFLAGA